MSDFNYKDFDPKLHEKYSPYFFKNLRRLNQNGYLSQNGFYRDAGVYVHEDGERWFGVAHEGDFIGCGLMSFLCYSDAWSKVGCYSRLNGRLQKVENFWDDYKERGRCAIDPGHEQHFRNAENRYSIDGDVRTCNWCGVKHKIQKRLRVSVVESWVELKQKEGAGNE